jgi:hypothetical protein
MKVTTIRWVGLFGLLAAGVLASAQGQPAANQKQDNAQTKALVVNGAQAPNAVVQVNGRLYADVLAVAQLTGATVSVQPSRVVLNVPNAAPAQSAQGLSAQGLSRDFAKTAIGHLADLREWRAAVAMTIRFGIPESQPLEIWLRQYHSRAEESLRLAAVSATTPADKAALELLQNEFNNTVQWDNNAAQDRQSFNGAKAVDPNALQNDPLRARIIECDRFLNSMISSGTFSDIGLCR